MDQLSPDRRRRPWIRWGIGLAAAAAVTGGVVAAALPASADPTPSSATTNATTDQARGGRAGETVLTGTDAEKATAAALAAVPGATIDRVETDADGAAYEAHLTKADGTRATVKFDKNFTVTSVEAGMGYDPVGPPEPWGPGAITAPALAADRWRSVRAT